MPTGSTAARPVLAVRGRGGGGGYRADVNNARPDAADQAAENAFSSPTVHYDVRIERREARDLMNDHVMTLLRQTEWRHRLND